MSFLFSWTKYFRSNKEPQPEEIEEIEEEEEEEEKQLEIANIDNDNNNNNEDEKYDDESDIDSDDDDDDDDNDLLGGGFETLEEEIKYLREQNNKLKSKYKYHKSQHKLFKNNFKKTGVMQMKINGKLVNVKQPHYNISLDELSQKVEARLPKFLQKADQSTRNDTIYIPSDVEGEIGIIDIKTVDWWDMVKFDTVDKTDALATFENNDENLQYEDTQALSGPFIVLRESDIIDAIACFVAQCVMQIPECHNLDHEEMICMINGTFSELKEKGPLGKMMDWGSFIYQTYGWTSTAYTVYSNAAMAKTVLSCLVSAAWVIGVL